MNHLVHHHPIASQIIFTRLTSEVDTNCAATITPSGAALYARAILRHHENSRGFDRKFSIVSRDCLCGTRHPFYDGCSRQVDATGREGEMDHAAIDTNVGCGE